MEGVLIVAGNQSKLPLLGGFVTRLHLIHATVPVSASLEHAASPSCRRVSYGVGDTPDYTAGDTAVTDADGRRCPDGPERPHDLESDSEMELARRRDEGKSRHLPPVAHTAASVTNQRGDKQEKTKATCRTIDVTNTGRVTQRQHNKDRSDMHRPLGRRRDYDRLSIGSPIPAILPQDEETDNRELGVSSPFPAIKVSSCGELRSTLTTASEEELLTSSTAVSAGLLRLSTPLYRRSTDGRYLQVTSQLFPPALRPVSPSLPPCSSPRGSLLRHTNSSVQCPSLLSSLYISFGHGDFVLRE